jgi:hypothetical protein
MGDADLSSRWEKVNALPSRQPTGGNMDESHFLVYLQMNLPTLLRDPKFLGPICSGAFVNTSEGGFAYRLVPDQPGMDVKKLSDHQTRLGRREMRRWDDLEFFCLDASKVDLEFPDYPVEVWVYYGFERMRGLRQRVTFYRDGRYEFNNSRW